METFNAIVLDFDFKDETKKGKQEALSSLLKLQLIPSSIVETKNGYHVYWFLEKGS
ncbi:MAG: hypothetical protein IIB83_05595, partial [Bacteroidetes bacterium]|nr:hypothetical protein [Bacteroidota bacterium]